MRKIFLSLASKLCFYILLLTLVIFGCICVVYNTYSTRREEAQAIRYTTLLLENMLQKTDRQLAGVENLVALTEAEVVRRFHQPDSLMAVVRQMVDKDTTVMGGCVAFEPYFFPDKGKYFMEYVCLDSLGTVVEQHLGSDQYNYHKMSWFTLPRYKRQGVWSEPYFDEGGGNVLMITYSLPILDKAGHPCAVLTADVSLDMLTAEINQLRPFPDSYSFILSSTGHYLVHPDKRVLLDKTIFDRAEELHSGELADIGHELLKDRSGARRLELQEADVLVCYAPMLRYGWTGACVCPYQTIMSELGSTTLTVLLILLVGLLLLLLSIRYLVVVGTRPLVSLAQAAYHIAKGNFDSPLPVVDTKDEMRQLHDAFAFMQGSLKTYIEELTATTRSKERIESELHIARNIQMSLVPKTFTPFPGSGDLDLYGFLRPAREVGGDFYDFFVRGHQLFFAIGDVSGKGVPASLVMAVTRTLFRALAAVHESPAQVLRQLNRAISEHNDENMFITMYVGVLDLPTGRLTYCNAGHNSPLLVPREGPCRFQSVKPNLPVGILEGFGFEEQTEDLSDGTALFLYTDGLTEAGNAGGGLLGEARVAGRIDACTDRSAQALVETLLQCVHDFAGGSEQSDDLTLFCLRIDRNQKNS